METEFELYSTFPEDFIAWLNNHILGMMHISGLESLDGSNKYIFTSYVNISPPTRESPDWSLSIELIVKESPNQKGEGSIVFDVQAIDNEYIKVHVTYSDICKGLVGEMLLAIPKKYWRRREDKDSAGIRKQKGRYRLTDVEINRRRELVIKANNMRTDNPELTWKQIAKNLDIPERTLRDWRHNPIYQ